MGRVGVCGEIGEGEKKNQGRENGKVREKLQIHSGMVQTVKKT